MWSVEQEIRVARQIQDLNNDYLEDPTWGMEGMARVRSVDVVLLDTTFWGGLRQAYLAGKVCETFQVGVAVHSSGEPGVQLATVLHLGAALPNLVFAADAGRRLCDWPDLAACRAPSPLLVQYNRGDHHFTVEEMQEAYSGEFYDGPHKFDLAMQESAFDWLEEQLVRS